jgi:DNA primase
VSNARVDFETIAARVDLVRLIEADGIEVRRGKAFCPFHANEHTPALSIYHRNGRWNYKCHGCGANGDAISWVAAREGISAVDAARKLGGPEITAPKSARKRKQDPPPPPAQAVPSAYEDPEWQWVLNEIIALAEETLWSPIGADAREWLAWRGLAEHTIRRYRLGFTDRGYETSRLTSLRDQDGALRSIHVSRGITLPWVAPGSWYSAQDDELQVPRWVGCNVRCLMPDVFTPIPQDRKCRALTGSVRGHGYPWSEFLPSQSEAPVLIVEGEIDALLADQDVGHMVNVMTVGGSGQNPQSAALSALDLCSTWLLAHDHDKAGAEAAMTWRKRSPAKSRRILLPKGKDIGEFVQAGGSLRAWIAEELSRIAT